jgi:hypothetical protein
MAVFRGDKQVAGGGGGTTPPIDPTTIIDDVIKAPNKVYSSNKTEERLLEVQNTISMGQSDKAKMWQKTYLNVKVGDTLYINTTGDYVLDKVIVQPYKFVEGTQNIVETLKTFNNTEASNFFYNDENVEFTGAMRIIDKYNIGYSFESVDGFYESDMINKSDYLIINGIEVN